MSDLNDKLFEVVKKNLTGIELESIKQLIADAGKVERLEREAKEHIDVCADLRKRLEGREDRVSQLAHELLDANEKIKGMEAQVFDAKVAAKAGKIIAEDRNRLFDIVGSAYKHYTHTTTRQEIVSGGQFAHESWNGSEHVVTPMSNSDEVVDVTTTTTKD